ncbi:hypothetical protein ACLB2K_020181 [Fragaria x ananassa]
MPAAVAGIRRSPTNPEILLSFDSHYMELLIENEDHLEDGDDETKLWTPALHRIEDGLMAHGRHGTDPPRYRTAAGMTIGHGSNAEHATAALSYAETPNNTLVGFIDVGYLSDPHKEHSQTSYVFTIGNTAISWRSTKQTLVETSSNHAEIIALHETVRECVWLRSIIKHIRGTNGLNSTTYRPTCIYEDNAACIEQMKLGYIKGDNTKHISPKFFYNQQQQAFLNI